MSYRNYIKILTHTWPKDSHDLFDYESSHLLSREFKITSSARFVRNADHSIQAIEAFNFDSQAEPSENTDCLFQIKQDITGRFYVSNGENSSSSLELIVRGLKKDENPIGYELKVGDNVKIGRVKFMIREIKDSNGITRRIRNPLEEKDYQIQDKMETEEEAQTNPITCRICLMDKPHENAMDNLLINPCKCKGSCENVHTRCLRQWLACKDQQRDKQNGPNSLHDHSKVLACEICKGYFPSFVRFGDYEYNLINLKKPDNEPYLLLERVETEKLARGLFLVKASDCELSMGRGHNSNVFVSDISVSRLHASIRYQEGKFMLFDNKSKFGTLVEVKKPLEISPEKTIIQIGKTVIVFSLKREKVTLEESIQTSIDAYHFFDGLKYGPKQSHVELNDYGFETTTDEPKLESKLLSQSKKISKIKFQGKQHIRKIQS